MKTTTGSWDSVEVEVPTRFGRVQLASGSWQQPIDLCSRFDSHHLQYSVLPAKYTESARSCFRNHWDHRRFEACGSAFFIPAGNEIHFRSEVRQLQSVVCEFHPQSMDELLEQDLNWEDFSLHRMLDIRNEAICRLCRQLVQEIRDPGFASDFLVDALATQVGVELSRHVRKRPEGQRPGKLAPWRLKVIDQRLAEVQSMPSLEELAGLCSLSVRHLCRAFQATRRQSLGAYIAEQRAAHAKRMIASGMHIKAVAYELGFSAPSNFTRAFRRATGESPKQFREHLQASRTAVAVS